MTSRQNSSIMIKIRN